MFGYFCRTSICRLHIVYTLFTLLFFLLPEPTAWTCLSPKVHSPRFWQPVLYSGCEKMCPLSYCQPHRGMVREAACYKLITYKHKHIDRFCCYVWIHREMLKESELIGDRQDRKIMIANCWDGGLMCVCVRVCECMRVWASCVTM